MQALMNQMMMGGSMPGGSGMPGYSGMPNPAAMLSKGSWGKGAGKGGGGGWQGGIEGLHQSLSEAFAPFATIDPELTSPDKFHEFIRKISQKIEKAAGKFVTDERVEKTRGNTNTFAKVLIEEFCDSAMGAMSQSCWEKEWFPRVEVVEPLLVACTHIFKGKKCCTRLVTPLMRPYVEDGVFKYREEERIDKNFWSTIECAGTLDTHRKKGHKNLQTSYDEAFSKAEYGQYPTDPPGLGLIQDFLFFWMSDFVGRSHDVLTYGVPNGHGTQVQKLYVTTLFQALCDPTNNCIPYDLLSQVENMPPAPWYFIAEAVEIIFKKKEADRPFKRFKGGGKGF